MMIQTQGGLGLGATQTSLRAAIADLQSRRKALEGQWRAALKAGKLTEQGYPLDLVKVTAQATITAVTQGLQAIQDFTSTGTVIFDTGAIDQMTSSLAKRSNEFGAKFRDKILAARDAGAGSVALPGFFAWMSVTLGDVEGVYLRILDLVESRPISVSIAIGVANVITVLDEVLSALALWIGGAIDDAGNLLPLLGKLAALGAVVWVGAGLVGKFGSPRRPLRGAALGYTPGQRRLIQYTIQGGVAGLAGLVTASLFDRPGDNPLDFLRRSTGAIVGGAAAALLTDLGTGDG